MRFRHYGEMPDEPLFTPGQRLVVAAVNEDGSLQCFPLSRFNDIGYAGDTVFDQEIFRAFPLTAIHLPVPWSGVEPFPAESVADLSQESAAWCAAWLWRPGR